MTKEQILQAMQEHVIQLKIIGDKSKVLQDELLKLSPEDKKWYEQEFSKWLIGNGLYKK
jgi:hypothetical protein